MRYQTRLDQTGQRAERRLQHARWPEPASIPLRAWLLGLGLSAIVWLILWGLS